MNRLKFERVERGLSQHGLALLADVPQALISLTESGRWNPTRDQLDRLARALEVSPPSVLLTSAVLQEVEGCVS